MRRVKTIYLAYFLIGCFFLVERLLRKGQAAKSWQAGEEDKGSTRAIGSAFGTSVLALLLAPLLNKLKLGRMSSNRLAWGGVVAMAGGLGLRVWAARLLGSYYTRTLLTQEGQHIITDGPYRLVRHPGYLGVIMLWLGAGVAAANWLVAATIGVLMLRAYRLRMQAEEAMLARTFPGEYEDYACRTRRLIPFLY